MLQILNMLLTEVRLEITGETEQTPDLINYLLFSKGKELIY